MAFGIFYRKYYEERFLKDLKKCLVEHANLLKRFEYIQSNTYLVCIAKINHIEIFDIRVVNYALDILRMLYNNIEIYDHNPRVVNNILKRFRRDLRSMLAHAKHLENKYQKKMAIPLIEELLKESERLEVLKKLPKMWKVQERMRELIRKDLGFVPRSRFDDFIPQLYKCGSYEEFIKQLQQRVELTKRYFKEVGYTAYTKKIIDENFWNFKFDSSPINRLKFEKTHTRLVPLGGRFQTKYLIRIVSQGAYTAWKKAQDVGIPVEEIVRAYPAKNGMVRVYCKYEGEQFAKYWNDHLGQKHELNEINRQKNLIEERLIGLGITHGHLHDRNFTVKEVNGRIIVKAIDFDLSISP